MAVKREGKGEFRVSVEAVLNAINAVLATSENSYRYDHPVFNSNTRTFEAVIKPSLWPMLLPTFITITAVASEKLTIVKVGIRSQWFIFGDVFNFYSRYISNFLSALDSKLNGQFTAE